MNEVRNVKNMGLWISRTNFYSICENFVIMMVESSYFCMVAGSGCKSFILLLLNYFIEDVNGLVPLSVLSYAMNWVWWKLWMICM